MPFPEINGSLLPFLKKREVDFDPQRGWIYRYHFNGTSQSLMEAQGNAFAAAGIACRIDEEGGISLLEVNDSTQQYTIDTWQIIGSDERADIFTNTVVTGFTQTYGTSILGPIRKGLNEGQSSTEVGNTLLAAPYSMASGDVVTLTYLYALAQGGQDQRKSQYTLRHTTNAPNRYLANIADVDVNCVYTTSQLLAETTDASLWIFPLPDRMVYKISNIPSEPAYTNYQWGWLKSTSTETTAANNRLDITTEYTLDNWSVQPNGLYALAT